MPRSRNHHRPTRRGLEQAAPLLYEVVQEFLLAWDLEQHMKGNHVLPHEPGYVTKARKALSIAQSLHSEANNKVMRVGNEEGKGL